MEGEPRADGWTRAAAGWKCGVCRGREEALQGAGPGGKAGSGRGHWTWKRQVNRGSLGPGGKV